MELGVVLLVAGQSKRMGRTKALLPWWNRLRVQVKEKQVWGANQELVIDSICMALRSLGDQVPIVGVLGASSSDTVMAKDMLRLRERLEDYGITCIENANPKAGQGVSLRLGVQALQDIVPLDGILCAVGDQPLLDASVVQALASTFEQVLEKDPQAIVVPRYQPEGHSGNPVVFASTWAQVLQAIPGDQGGRSILQGAGAHHIFFVDVPSFYGMSRGRDIDTPEEYEEIIRLVNEVVR